MIRATLQQVIEWLRQIDHWHNYALDDRKLQTIAPESQDFGMDVLNEVLNMVKALEKKPSPAHLMSLAKQVQTRFLQDKQLNLPDEDPSTWMTSREYAQSQGFETLKDLIKHKIKEDQKNSDIKIEDGDSTSPLDPSLEKQIDFWDSLGEESA